MEFDRDLGIQVGLSVVAVVLFVVGLLLLSGAYGFIVETEDEPLDGTIDGNYELVDGAVDEDGPATIEFDGTFENDFEVNMQGEIEGEITDGEFTGEFSGTVEGAIDGTATGTVSNGLFSETDETLTGEFDGEASGTTSMDLTPEGGIALVGLMIAFVFVMPAFGFLIERLRSDTE